jgi:NADPH-dependent glutamate synthase beta subunit-like oxidoreductase
MPARKEEIKHAGHEGVKFQLLTAPVTVHGNKEGWVTGLECLQMELGEPDASGRRRRPRNNDGTRRRGGVDPRPSSPFLPLCQRGKGGFE